ncbi:MAG: toll/interleukin-1 receptor domain-containing protein [Anaerolineae bacterium]|nr:toll/interleukin-1 receptor domain-containing protein [Anaerolineae bacterium]
MRKVFISYAQPDSAFAHRISEQLSKASIPNWLYERDLKPGDDWKEQTARALRDSTHGLFLLSSSSLNSPATTFEWQYFLTQNKPLVVGQIQEVHPEEIPWRLSRTQIMDLTHNFSKGMRSLIDIIRSDDTLVTERNTSESARSGHPRASVTLELDLKELDTEKLVHLITELNDKGIEDIRVVQVGQG